MNCPILNLFAKCSCCAGTICSFCVQLTIGVIAIVFGALVAWKPKKTIEIQIALYRPFNWKIEPISMEKEIRNTRVMGLVVLVLGVISLACILLK
ncbi:MAG: hypothetical protein NTX47_00040 [Candidatus Omnitrophica bacterium]|nr:hypothetical protein [Candidatus Omnitrophota bacterium]